LLKNTSFDSGGFTADGSLRDIILVNEPTITVTDCQSLISFSTECQDIRSDETVCIDFTTSNFADINRVKYTVVYDPNRLEFIK